MGLRGGGKFGAKQTARVSTLRANIALCLNYTPWVLQFSHTLTLSSPSLNPADTPPTPLQPASLAKYTALSDRKSTSNKLSPPRQAAFSWQLRLTSKDYFGINPHNGFYIEPFLIISSISSDKFNRISVNPPIATLQNSLLHAFIGFMSQADKIKLH